MSPKAVFTGPLRTYGCYLLPGFWVPYDPEIHTKGWEMELNMSELYGLWHEKTGAWIEGCDGPITGEYGVLSAALHNIRSGRSVTSLRDCMVTYLPPDVEVKRLPEFPRKAPREASSVAAGALLAVMQRDLRDQKKAWESRLEKSEVRDSTQSTRGRILKVTPTAMVDLLKGSWECKKGLLPRDAREVRTTYDEAREIFIIAITSSEFDPVPLGEAWPEHVVEWHGTDLKEMHGVLTMGEGFTNDNAPELLNGI